MDNHILGYIDDALGAAIVSIKNDVLLDVVPLHEGQDIVGIAVTELIDRLIVVADYAEVCAQLLEQIDEALLHRIRVLIFIYGQVLDLFGNNSTEHQIAFKLLHHFTQDK